MSDTKRLSGRRILLVEDEAFVAMNLAMALQDAGAIVTGPVMRLADAVAAAEAGEHDGAILDVDLAGEDVFPAARRLDERGVPFVFHTGHGQRDEIGSDFPGSPVAKKPVPTHELLALLASVLR